MHVQCILTVQNALLLHSGLLIEKCESFAVSWWPSVFLQSPSEHSAAVTFVAQRGSCVPRLPSKLLRLPFRADLRFIFYVGAAAGARLYTKVTQVLNVFEQTMVGDKSSRQQINMRILVTAGRTSLQRCCRSVCTQISGQWRAFLVLRPETPLQVCVCNCAAVM